MPFMDGLELCHAAKTLSPTIKIVMLTAYNDFEYTKRAIQVKVDAYLMKPITIQEFQETLEQLLAELDSAEEVRNHRRQLLKQYLTANLLQREQMLERFMDEIGRLSAGDGMEAVLEPVSSPGTNQSIRKVLNIIGKEYCTDISLDSLAKQVCFSKGYLSTFLKMRLVLALCSILQSCE